MQESVKSKRIRSAILIVAVAVLICSISIVSFTNSPSQKIKKQLDLGQKYLNDLKYEQAAAVFEAVIEISPGIPDAYKGAMYAYEGLGERRKVRDSYLRAIDNLEANSLESLHIQYVEALEKWMDEALETEAFEDAVTILEWQKEIEYEKTPEYQDKLINAMMLSAKTGKNVEWIYLKVIDLDPKNVDAYVGIIEYFLSIGDYENALKYINIGYKETGSVRIDALRSRIPSALRGEWNMDTFDSFTKEITVTLNFRDGRQIDASEVSGVSIEKEPGVGTIKSLSREPSDLEGYDKVVIEFVSSTGGNLSISGAVNDQLDPDYPILLSCPKLFYMDYYTGIGLLEFQYNYHFLHEDVQERHTVKWKGNEWEITTDATKVIDANTLRSDGNGGVSGRIDQSFTEVVTFIVPKDYDGLCIAYSTLQQDDIRNPNQVSDSFRIMRLN